jgi:hypothetical protein
MHRPLISPCTFKSDPSEGPGRLAQNKKGLASLYGIISPQKPSWPSLLDFSDELKEVSFSRFYQCTAIHGHVSRDIKREKNSIVHEHMEREIKKFL